MRMDKLVKTAKVALAAATFAIDRPYTYRVPDALAEKLVPGMRVLVPFGAGNRPSEGLVLSLADEVPEGRLKEIGTLLDPRPVLTQEGIRLALWMRERFFCTVYATALTMLPTGLWYVLRESYAIAPGVDRETWEEKTARSPKAKQIMGLLYAAGGQADLDQSKAIPDLKDPRAILRELEKAGLITRQTQAKRKVGDKTEPIARLTMDPAEAMALSPASRHRSAPMRVTTAMPAVFSRGRNSVEEISTAASRSSRKAHTSRTPRTAASAAAPHTATASSSAAQPAPTSAITAAPSIAAQSLSASAKNASVSAAPSASLWVPRTRASIPARSGSRIHAPFITPSPPSARLPSSPRAGSYTAPPPSARPPRPERASPI